MVSLVFIEFKSFESRYSLVIVIGEVSKRRDSDKMFVFGYLFAIQKQLLALSNPVRSCFYAMNACAPSTQ